MNGPRDDDPDNGFGHGSGPDFAPPQYGGPPPGQGPCQPPYGYPEQPPPPRPSRRPAESATPSETPIPSATAPTPSPSRRAPERTEGPGFKFAAPPGWKPSPEWGERNDGRIVDDAGNQISIYVWDNVDARRRCQAELNALAIWEPGEISELKERKVGGKPAPGGQLVGESTYRMRCVSANKAVYNISLKTAPGDLDASNRAYNATLDSWKWT